MTAMAKNRKICILLLRLIAFGVTLLAAPVMATSHEKITPLGLLTIEANYTNSPAFKYFVIANAIATVYGFLVLFLPQESLLWRQVLAVLDLIFSLLLTSSISAALAIAQVGKKGNSHAGWFPICGQVPKYCNQTAGALAAGFIGLVVYLMLLLHSIYTLLSPPLV